MRRIRFLKPLWMSLCDGQIPIWNGTRQIMVELSRSWYHLHQSGHQTSSSTIGMMVSTTKSSDKFVPFILRFSLQSAKICWGLLNWQSNMEYSYFRSPKKYYETHSKFPHVRVLNVISCIHFMKMIMSISRVGGRRLDVMRADREPGNGRALKPDLLIADQACYHYKAEPGTFSRANAILTCHINLRCQTFSKIF